MASLNYSQLCVIQKDTKFPFNLTDFNNVTTKGVQSQVEIIGLGTVIGILMILLVDVLLGFEVRFTTQY